VGFGLDGFSNSSEGGNSKFGDSGLTGIRGGAVGIRSAGLAVWADAWDRSTPKPIAIALDTKTDSQQIKRIDHILYNHNLTLLSVKA
jgi:hypothetical protein